MIIKETKHWQIKVNPDQAYLGRCVVVARRDVGSLSELTEEEWVDFSQVVKMLEFAIKKAFGGRMFNWTCLMNNAFKAEKEKNELAKPHVHWHCRARYNSPVKFAGEVFEDPEFAHHYDNKRRTKVSQELLAKIADKILEELK